MNFVSERTDGNRPVGLRASSMRFDDMGFLASFQAILIAIRNGCLSAEAEYQQRIDDAYAMLEGRLSESRLSIGRSIRRVCLAHKAAKLCGFPVKHAIGAHISNKARSKTGIISQIHATPLGQFYTVMTLDGDAVEIIDSDAIRVSDPMVDRLTDRLMDRRQSSRPSP